MVEIRAPRVEELELLRDIERDAGRAFAEIDMGEIADDEPLSIADLRGFAELTAPGSPPMLVMSPSLTC